MTNQTEKEYVVLKNREYLSCDDVDHAKSVAKLLKGEVYIREWCEGEIVKSYPLEDWIHHQSREVLARFMEFV